MTAAALDRLAGELGIDEVTFSAKYLADPVFHAVAVRAVAADRDVQAVINAWSHAGRVPSYHRAWQEQLRSSWPVLAKALDALAGGRQDTSRTRQSDPRRD